MESRILESKIRSAVEDALFDYEAEYGNLESCGAEVFVDIDECGSSYVDVNVFEK